MISDDDLLKAGYEGRKITIGIKTSCNFPPAEEIHADLARLRQSVDNRRMRVKEFRQEIKRQFGEQIELLKLVENPGIYNPNACAASAKRCDAHIKSFEALIKKEQAGVDQLNGMIKTLEERLCLQEKMSQ